MAQFDFILETSTSTGTGDLTLDGAVVGHQAFLDRYTVDEPLYYGVVAVDADGVPTGQWELGYGRVTAGSALARDNVNASSDNDAVVNFSAGTKRVYAALSVAAVQALIDAAVAAHAAAADPHGDRAYVDGYARPGITALGSDTIVASFAGTRLQTRTAAGAVTLNASNYAADRETVVVVTNGTGGSVAVTAVGAWVWLTGQPTTLAAGERGVLSLLSTTAAEGGTLAAWAVEA